MEENGPSGENSTKESNSKSMLLHQTLKWKEEGHANSLKNNIISMFKSGELYDTVITIESSHFLCHRMILAAGSSYFYTMFTSNLIETTMKEIPIKGIKKEIFKDILQYLYCGEVDINGDNVQGLLHASDVFFLESLKQGCMEFYQHFITAENCLGIWQFSDQCNAATLQEQSLQYALKEFTTVYKNQEFLQLTQENLSFYLAHEDLQVHIEEHTCDAFLRWLEHSHESRSKYIMDILPTLRLSSQLSRTIKQKMLDNKLLKANPEVTLFLQQTLNHLLFSEPLPKQAVLQPVRNNNQNPLGCVVLGGYVNGRRSKFCHVADYKEKIKWVSTATVCEIPSQYNIEMASCVVNDIIYISGCGEGCNEIWKLDMNRTLWTRCHNMSLGRICHFMVSGPSVDNCFYILGGYNQPDDEIIGDIEIHNASKNETRHIGQLIKPTACCTAHYYDGMIYTFGGVTEEERPAAWLQMLNTDTKECTLLPLKLPVKSHRLQSVLCIDKIIALGLQSSFIIDIATLHSTCKQKMCEGTIPDEHDLENIIQEKEGLNMDLFGIELLGDKIMIMGGRKNQDDKDLSDNIKMTKVEDYLSLEDQKWDFIGRLPYPMAVYMTGLVTVKENFVQKCSFTGF